MMEPTGEDAPERHPHGQVLTEIVDDHILVMTVDRVEKKNAFTPKIMAELRASEIPVTAAEIELVWADAVQRDRALAGLLADGLVCEVDGGYELP